MPEIPDGGGVPSLAVVAREWGRLGCIGFGGPPAHIGLLRELCVRRRRWLRAEEFEDAIAACNLLPGPASTQLAIFCAWRVRGRTGALVGGLAFIFPGLLAILALGALFLAGSPPAWIRGAGAGAGAAVAAVAARTGVTLLAASRRRADEGTGGNGEPRFWVYLAVGGLTGAVAGPWLVLALVACGGVEVGWRRARARAAPRAHRSTLLPVLAAAAPAVGGLGALAWVALKVGALSYGGGFVIVPLMQHDAVTRYHWMSGGQFLNAVALGQVTPGPLVQTVAVVGYAAAGVGGGLLAAAVAFAPSFAFVLGGARHFDRLRANADARSFLGGAGPAAIGAILGAAVPLGLALSEPWQAGVLAGAALLLVARRSTVSALLAAGAVGALLGLAGAPLPR
ncbi:MAG TPA: chromate efflux transporter [Solirubrobacteraceae bacterium]|nr:chromate efflux transporter [Solirubrobacteraceae bacterium]